MAGPVLPPPGWHPDPSGRHELRYWDGAGWSEHVSDRGQVSADDLGGAVPQVEEPASPLGAPPPSEPAAAAAAGPRGVVDPGATWAGPPTASGAPAMMRSISGLAASLSVFLWIAAVLGAFGAIAFVNRAVVATDLLDFDFGVEGFSEFGDLRQRADTADDLVGAAAGLMALCSLVIFVLLVIWMWRVAKNAQLLGRTNPRFGPGWTIGGWFVPLANLVIPVLVMQDLWRGSNPAVARDDPAWRRGAGAALVGWWWAAYLLASARFGGGQDADTIDDLETVRAFDIVASIGMVAAVAAAILLISVIRRITRRQEAMWTEIPVGSVRPA